MRDLKTLQQYWLDNQSDELMLGTIVGKRGSGYRSVGAKKIICRSGGSSGYLSGGCLEGDIIETGLTRWGDAPFIQSFSTMSEEDRLMGYQTGCAGIIDVLFERLPSGTDQMQNYLPYGPQGDIAAIAVSLDADSLGQRILLKSDATIPANCFIDKWVSPLELYIIGCGPNTHVFAELASAMGWHATFLDYRRGNTVPEKQGVSSRIVQIEDIGREVKTGAHAAVILSTHNYEADLNIMGQLNGQEFFYLGCVGPRKRFEQMRDDLKKFRNIEMDAAWADKVHAPAGLTQGHTPEEIALSIAAQIQQAMAK